MYLNKLWELNGLMYFKKYISECGTLETSGNILFPSLPFMPCLSPFSLPFEKGKLSEAAGRKSGGRVCCHLADHYLFTEAAQCHCHFFFKASGNLINLFVTDTGFLLSLPSAGLTCFFFLMLFCGRFSFVRQLNQNQLHSL